MRGIVEFPAEHGTSTFKGPRLNVEEFMRWASERFGISGSDIRKAMQKLPARGVLNASAKGEIILGACFSA